MTIRRAPKVLDDSQLVFVSCDCVCNLHLEARESIDERGFVTEVSVRIANSPGERRSRMERQFDCDDPVHEAIRHSCSGVRRARLAERDDIDLIPFCEELEERRGAPRAS